MYPSYRNVQGNEKGIFHRAIRMQETYSYRYSSLFERSVGLYADKYVRSLCVALADKG
jgi:hypothetical protein